MGQLFNAQGREIGSNQVERPYTIKLNGGMTCDEMSSVQHDAPGTAVVRVKDDKGGAKQIASLERSGEVYRTNWDKDVTTFTRGELIARVTKERNSKGEPEWVVREPDGTKVGTATNPGGPLGAAAIAAIYHYAYLSQ